jgi:hypothetical protein
MKRFLVPLAFLCSCVNATRETSSKPDTLASDGYEDFSEVTTFSIKDDLQRNTLTIQGKRKTIQDYLIKFYAPDTFTTYSSEDSISTPGYIITEARVIEDNFFSGDKKECGKRSILFTGRGNFVDQEFYDLLFLDKEADGELVLMDKLTFDGSEGQSSTIVSVKPEDLTTRKNCKVLSVTSSTEGGDINLHKSEWIEYYIADMKSFHPILKVETENTDIQDYEATQDENQNSSSDIREVVILQSSSNGLFDIEVNYTNRQNGNVIQQSTERYSFDGEQYVKK